MEVDAIPPAELRGLVRRCIEQHIDRDALRAVELAEQSERQWLTAISRQYAEDVGEEDYDDGKDEDDA